MDVATHFGTEHYGFVVTPNVDHFIRCQEDPGFRDLYRAAAFVLLDSRFAARLVRLTHHIDLPVCPGSDLTAALFESIKPDDPIVLIGGRPEQIEHLRRRFGLRAVQHYNPPMGFIRDPAAVETCLQFIEQAAPFRFCFLAVGSPQQEKLAKALKERGRARGLALCVGASLDFLTGGERRAPRWMQQAGLVWSYRLLQNPRRLASRYLVRGPRFFAQLFRSRFVLRPARVCSGIDAPTAHKI